jgi:cobalt-zinc-cadmium efflux system protein
MLPTIPLGLCRGVIDYERKNLILSIAINIVITITEIIVGLLIGSLAIVSDAVHNFFDVGAMVMSLFGERASSKSIDSRHTYSYKRAEILVALFCWFPLSSLAMKQYNGYFTLN